MSDYDAMEITAPNTSQEKLEVMSDYEINLAVAHKLNYKTMCVENANDDIELFVIYDKDHGLHHAGWIGFSPCEDWSDVMQILEKYKIGLEPYFNETWVARKKNINNRNLNPKRAICEVFLMMDITNP